MDDLVLAKREEDKFYPRLKAVIDRKTKDSYFNEFIFSKELALIHWSYMSKALYLAFEIDQFIKDSAEPSIFTSPLAGLNIAYKTDLCPLNPRETKVSLEAITGTLDVPVEGLNIDFQVRPEFVPTLVSAIDVLLEEDSGIFLVKGNNFTFYNNDKYEDVIFNISVSSSKNLDNYLLLANKFGVVNPLAGVETLIRLLKNNQLEGLNANKSFNQFLVDRIEENDLNSLIDYYCFKDRISTGYNEKGRLFNSTDEIYTYLSETEGLDEANSIAATFRIAKGKLNPKYFEGFGLPDDVLEEFERIRFLKARASVFGNLLFDLKMAQYRQKDENYYLDLV